MTYFPRVIIINNNTGNELISEPLLKIFLEEFGWRSVNNQVNGEENKYQTVEIQMYFESQLCICLLL